MKICKNNSGVVLVTVVIMTAVMMVFAISLISISASQSVAGQHQIDRIKAEQLAKGALWYNYTNLQTNNISATPPAENLDNKTYTPSIVSPGAGAGFFSSTTEYQVTVNY